MVWGYLPAIFLVHFSPDLNESNGKWTSVPVVILLYDHLLLWVVIYSLSDELRFFMLLVPCGKLSKVRYKG